MAAMARNTILSLLKSFSNNPSLPFRPKVSRVSFTSASRYSEGRQAADDDRRGREYSPYNADEAVGEPRGGAGDVGDTIDKAKQKTQEMKDKAEENTDALKHKAKEAKDTAAESTREMNEKAKEKLGPVADKAYDMREKTMDKAGEMADGTKEYAHDAKEKTKEYAHGAKESTKSGVETVAEKAKQTVQGAWDAAKDTTQKIKETVVGKSEDHVKKANKEKVMDQDVVDSRRRRDEEQGKNKY